MLKLYLMYISVRGTVDPRLSLIFRKQLWISIAWSALRIGVRVVWTFTLGKSWRTYYDAGINHLQADKVSGRLMTLLYFWWVSTKSCVWITPQFNTIGQGHLGRCLGPNHSTFMNGRMLKCQRLVTVSVSRKDTIQLQHYGHGLPSFHRDEKYIPTVGILFHQHRRD